MLIYVSGAYSAPTIEQRDENVANARAVAVRLWEMGHAVICPHLNTFDMESDCNATYEQYLVGDKNMIARCDAMVMVNGWENSKGATIEQSYAVRLGIPVYDANVGLPYLHPTEQRAPNQVQAFRETLGQMYRTHLDKNADYSPANILGTGEVGLATRLWDKTARFMNLMGFKIDVSEPAQYSSPKEPKHESIDDTLIDLAVYAIIGRLLRAGKWGN